MNIYKMKEIYKYFERTIGIAFAKNNFLSLLIFKVSDKIKYYRQYAICKTISPQNKVLSGPFKDIIYPKLEATGSLLLPKILGSYEDELHGIIEIVCKKKYTKILDIGCAEGYYAVGLASRIKNALVYAYDTNPKAIELCHLMASVNFISDRLNTGNFFSSKDLSNFDFGISGLIFCDCEGYEIELFNKTNVNNLKNCDIIIELHDCFNDSISATILPLFESTHKLTLVKSKRNKSTKNYPYLKNIKNIDNEMISERLNVLMKWAYLEAKILKNNSN